MKWKLILVLGGIILFLSFSQLAYTTSQTRTLDTSLFHFKLDNDSRIKFDAASISLGDANGLWNWIDDDGLRFYNLEMGSSDCPADWYIKVTGPANATILTLFENKRLRLSISAAANVTSTTQVYCGNNGEPTDIIPASADAGYNAATKVQSIQLTHSSSTTIRVLWAAEHHEGSEVIGGTIIDDVDFLMLYLTNHDFIGFFIACYTTRIGEAFYGLIMLAVSIVLYNRTESLPLCCILWLLIGSLGFIAAAPSISPFAVVLTSLGIIGLIYNTVWKGA